MPVLAIGGVELVALIVAAVAIAVLIAAWVFAGPMRGVLSHIPLVGGYVANVFDVWLSAVVRASASYLDSKVLGIGRALFGLGAGLWHLVYKITAGIAAAISAARYALNTAHSLYQQALGFAQNAANVALAGAEALYNDAIAHANNLYNHAIWFTQGQIAGVISLAQQLYGQAVAHTNDLYNHAIWFTQGQIATVESEIATVQSDVLSEANRLFGEAEQAITNVEGQVAADVAGLQGAINGIEGQVSGLEALWGVVAAIPLLQTAVTTLTTEAATCLEPLCDTVTPRAPQLGKLGNFLQGLETLGVDVLVAGLFTEAITNPRGLAQDTVGLVQAVGDPVVTGIRDLTGL